MGYLDEFRNGEERNPNSIYYNQLGEVDTTLTREQYYVEDANGKIQKGTLRGINFDKNGDIRYSLVNGRGKIDSGYDKGYFYKWQMYDNKEDCKWHIHSSDDWEL